MRFFDDVVKTITQNRKNGLQTNRNWFRETGSKVYNGFNGLVSSRLGKKCSRCSSLSTLEKPQNAGTNFIELQL
jgi:formamidopyrimidine-DNA glycosylase